MDAMVARSIVPLRTSAAPLQLILAAVKPHCRSLTGGGRSPAALINVLIRFALQADDQRDNCAADCTLVLVLFAGKTCLKSRPLHDMLQARGERLRINTC
jgi:hypothetical protein